MYVLSNDENIFTACLSIYMENGLKWLKKKIVYDPAPPPLPPPNVESPLRLN